MKYYTEDHVWVEIHGDEATVGMSQHAIDELGEINYIELPPEDEDIIVGEDIGLLESLEDSHSIYAPLSGTITVVNEELENDPALINESPEEKGWICRLTDFDSSDVDDMMNEEEYIKYIDSL